MSESAVDTAAPQSAGSGSTEKKPSQYYYWHGHEKERAKVGDVAPKASPVLVKSEKVEESPLLLTTALSKYSWCNNKTSVSVYVDFDGISEDNCKVEFHEKKLKVSIHPAGTGTVHILALHLAKEIDDAASSYRLKPNQLVMKLQKKDEATWYDLVDTKASPEDE